MEVREFQKEHFFCQYLSCMKTAFFCTNERLKIVQCRRLAQPSLQEVVITFCGEIVRLSSDKEIFAYQCYFGGKAPTVVSRRPDSEAARKRIEAENKFTFGRSLKKSASENSVLMMAGCDGFVGR